MSNQKVSGLPDGGAVQPTDEFYAARGGSQVKIAGSEIGGSLTPPVELDGIDPAQPVLVVKLASSQTALGIKLIDSDGNLLADFDELGKFDVKSFNVQDPPDIGSGASVAQLPGRITVVDDGTEDTFAAEDATFSQKYLRLRAPGHGDLLEISPTLATDVPLQIIEANSQTANVIEVWDNQFNTLLFAVTPSGGILAALPTSNPGPGLLWNSGGTVKVGT